MELIECLENLEIGQNELETCKEAENKILSKNQQKKLNRYEVISGHKKDKRKEERSRRRERFKERRQCGEKPKDETRKEQIERLTNAKKVGIKVCIDLQYATNMTNKETQRLCNQLKRIYGSNKASVSPFNLTFSNLKRDGIIYQTCVNKITGFEQFHVNMMEECINEAYDISKLIYLSPDAAEYIEDIEDDKVYVIGGLVDDTVQSRVSLQYTESVGLTARKLPIPLYMEKADGGTFKQILTVNQVFDILLKFQETKSWPEALVAGVPKRTGFVLKQEHKETS